MINTREAQWTLRRLVCVVPLAAFVLCVNTLGDPAKVISRGAYERGVADILLSGRHAAGVSEYNDRLMQRLYAEGLHAAPDVLVLGSSRVMPLRALDFAPRTFYNASVSSATLNDVLALRELFASRGGKTSLLIVGIDPWMLQANERMTAFHTLGPEFERACRKASVPDCDSVPFLTGPRRLLGALMSPSYFQASAATLWRRFSQAAGPVESLRATQDDDAEPQLAIRRADGSLRYPESFGADESQVRAGAEAFGREFGRRGMLFLPPKARPQPRFLHLLETLVRTSIASGTQVHLVLAPYHPDAWPALSASDSLVVQAERAVRGLGAALQVPVIGSYDPGLAGCPAAAEYHDPVHARESCLRRMIAQGTRPDPPPTPAR